MFPSNAKRKFRKIFYVKNKRLALLSIASIFLLVTQENVHLKRTFCVQKFGVFKNASAERIATCACLCKFSAWSGP